jgi:hypothetical protein
VTRGRKRLVLLVTLLVSLGARDAAAQNTAFRAGIRTRNDCARAADASRCWEEVVAQMRAAIQVDALESKDKVSTGRFLGISVDSIEYLPHFFLGEALLAKGDCSGAMAAWDESDRQGVVRALPTYVPIMERGFALCASKGILPPSDFRSLVRQAELALENAAAVRGRVATRRPSQDDAWRNSVSLQQQFQQAQAELDTAQARLAAGRRERTASALKDAVTVASRARDRFARISSELETAVERVSRLESQLQNLSRAVTAADDVDVSVGERLSRLPRTAVPPSVTASRARARGALASARALVAGRAPASPAALIEAARQVQEATRALLTVRDELARLATSRLTLEQRGISAALVLGTRRYLAGDYQAALSALNDPALVGEDAPFQAHAHAFKAASLFALFVRSGERTESLKEQARAEAKLCLGLTPGFQPDPRVFSPRFLAFFSETTARR